MAFTSFAEKSPWMNHFSSPLSKILACLIFLQALFFSVFITPLADTPDESGHYAYVVDLSKGLPLPVLGQVQADGKGGLASDMWRDWGDDSVTYRVNQMPQHPPLYYALAAVPYSISKLLTDDKAVHAHAARFLSAVAAGLLVWVMFQTLISAGLSPQQALPIAIWLPLLPMMTHISSGITNDVFLVLMCALATLYWVKFLHTQAIRFAYIGAFWLACAGATKMTAWVLIAAYVGIALFEMRTTFVRWCLHAVGLCLLAFSTALAWMARNHFLFNNALQVMGSGREPDPAHPGLGMVAFFKQQPFIEWLAHHTYGLLGFSGYCLTAPNAEVLSQHCSGGKIVTLSGGFSFWVMLLSLAIIAFIVFIKLMAQLGLNNATQPSQQPHSLQSWLAQGLGHFRPVHALLLLAAVTFALLLNQHFSAKGFRLSDGWNSAMVMQTFGLLFAWSALGLAAVFLSKRLHVRLWAYGMVLVTLFTLFLFYKSYQEFVDIGELRGVQGRYLFPFYPLILVGVGLALREGWLNRWLVSLITAALVLAHFVAYTGTYIPFFHSVRLS